MALLNPPGILPTAMWAIARLVADGRPIDLAQAEALLAPPSIRGGDDGANLRNTVRALRDLGLLRLEQDKTIQLTRPLIAEAADDFVTFTEQLRVAVLAPDANTGIGDNDEQRGPRDLTRALVWFLSLDPLGDPLAYSDVQSRQQRALLERVGKPFGNDTRWTSFTYWGPALGLVSPPLMATARARQLVPDPTGAIRQVVLSTWEAAQRMPARTFIERLLGELPVLPGGAYARALGITDDPDRLAPATSLALLRGDHEGWIRLERAADAPDSLLVIDPDAPRQTRAVTDITILGASDA